MTALPGCCLREKTLVNKRQGFFTIILPVRTTLAGGWTSTFDRSFSYFIPGKGIFMKTLLKAALVALVGISNAIASPVSKNQAAAPIVEQQKEIRADVLAERDGWDAIALEKRSELLTRQEKVLQLLAGKEIIGDLGERDQIEVINSLEWINALANNAEDERLVCKREATTGSKRPVRVCKTVAQMRRDREAARDMMTRGGADNIPLDPTGGM